MESFTHLLALVYLVALIGVGIFILVLFARFVKAHQRGADALEVIARNLSGGK